LFKVSIRLSWYYVVRISGYRSTERSEYTIIKNRLSIDIDPKTIASI